MHVVHNGEEGLISGFKVAKRVAPISRPPFADDTLLLCEALEVQIKNIKATLLCIEDDSCLKSKPIQKRVIRMKVDDLSLSKCAVIFRCKVESFPTSY